MASALRCSALNSSALRSSARDIARPRRAGRHSGPEPGSLRPGRKGCTEWISKILFHCILFWSFVFCSILFYCIMQHFKWDYVNSINKFLVLFYSILFCFVQFRYFPFCFVLFYSARFCSTVFGLVLLDCMAFSSSAFSSILFYSLMQHLKWEYVNSISQISSCNTSPF